MEEEALLKGIEEMISLLSPVGDCLNTLRAVIFHSASSPDAELECMPKNVWVDVVSTTQQSITRASTSISAQ